MIEQLARAVTCNLEWERLCRRGALLDETALVRAAAEYAQAVLFEEVIPEHPHADLPGRQIDLVAKAPGGSLLMALEAKWVCTTKGTRQWDREIAAEIARLEHLSSNMAPTARRLLLVAGPRGEVDSGFLTKRKNVGKQRRAIAEALLPLVQADEPGKYQVRKCAEWLRPFFRDVAKDVGGSLPSTYDAILVARSDSGEEPESISAWLWLLRRPRGAGWFAPASEWPVV